MNEWGDEGIENGELLYDVVLKYRVKLFIIYFGNNLVHKNSAI